MILITLSQTNFNFNYFNSDNWAHKTDLLILDICKWLKFDVVSGLSCLSELPVLFIASVCCWNAHKFICGEAELKHL